MQFEIEFLHVVKPSRFLRNKITRCNYSIFFPTFRFVIRLTPQLQFFRSLGDLWDKPFDDIDSWQKFWTVRKTIFVMSIFTMRGLISIFMSSLR